MTRSDKGKEGRRDAGYRLSPVWFGGLLPQPYPGILPFGLVRFYSPQVAQDRLYQRGRLKKGCSTKRFDNILREKYTDDAEYFYINYL
jgi:hypothetical protein